MSGVIAAATGSNWTAGGSILTFYFPVGLFVVVTAILCLFLGRPHRRVPERRILAPARAGAAGTDGAAGRDAPPPGGAGHAVEPGAGPEAGE